MKLFYYQVTDDKQEKWKLAHLSECEAVLRIAFHASIYSLSKEPTRNPEDDRKIRYLGDWWIDIDNKDITPELAIDRSIEDLRKIQKYLLLIGIDLSACELFISGGKGFHLRIPLEMMGGIASNDLPPIHKYMAGRLAERSGASGIDMSMYNQGMGKLIRVDGKPRNDNGNYKVPITWEEFRTLDAEKYFNLAKKPRSRFILTPPVENQELINMYSDSLKDVVHISKINEGNTTKSEHLKSLKGKIPECIHNLCEYTNIKKNSSFNYAKMDVAAFLNSSELSERDREAIISKFCENYQSDRHPSPGQREREIRPLLGKDKHKFSCNLIVNTNLDKSPCSGCPVRQERVQEFSARYKLDIIGNSYHRKGTGKKNEDTAISNFILEVHEVSYEQNDEGQQYDQAYVCFVHYQRPNLRPERVVLRISDFRSKASFIKALEGNAQTEWTGKDDECNFLKGMVTSEESLANARKVVPVKKQGMTRVFNADKDINDYCWVQQDWSWNGSVADTVQYRGPKMIGDMGEKVSTSVNLKGVQAKETELSHSVMMALLQSRGIAEVSILLGWASACWVKPLLQTGAYQEMFPVLHTYGVAGSGKSELTKTFSVLAGYDGVDKTTTNIGACTAYYLQAEVCSSTTIPRIFDEFNKTKMNVQRFRYVVEIVKSTGSKMALGRGKVTGSGEHSQVGTETTICTSPLILLGTTQTQELEVIQRSIILYLDKDDIFANSHKFKAQYVENYGQVSAHKQELIKYTRMLMDFVTKLTPEMVKEIWATTAWVKDDYISDLRTAKAVKVVAFGLELAHRAFIEAGCKKELLDYVKMLGVDGLRAYLNNRIRYSYLYSDGKTEAELALQKIISLATIDNGRGETVLREGIHYVSDETSVHLKLNSAYVQFVRLANEQRWMLEFDTAAGFAQSLVDQDYYLGIGKAAGVKTPSEWHAFSIQGLLDAKIDPSAMLN